MRASNKSSIITGAVLLLLAALFSISLLLLPLDYGVAGPGHNNIFYLLGDMLYAVYGFSSILIPAFLLVAGLSCFAAKWTARKTLRLLTALIPFFTCVVTESIIRSIVKLDHSAFSIVKILIALVTGAMLVVIEFLGTGIIADKLNAGGFKALRKVKAVKKSDSEIRLSDDLSEETEATEATDFKKLSKLELPKESFLDKLKKKFKKAKDDEDNEDEIDAEFEGAKKSTSTAFDDILEDVEVYSPIPDDDFVPEKETETVVDKENDPYKAFEIESPSLTNEEFEALTAPQEELEWHNLPPKPENLPPEYDAEFDENDPALEFPPKDEEPAAEEVAPEEVSEETVVEETSVPDYEVEDVVYEEEPKKEESKKEDPYAATRYIDTVIDNPRFPHKIVLHDGSEPEEEEVKKNPEVDEKPKYPTRIQLSDELPEEEEAVEEKTVEDEVKPEEQIPASQNRSVESFFEDTEKTPEISQKNLTDYFETVDSTAKAPELESEKEKSEKPVEEEKKTDEESQIFEQLAQQEEVNISTAAASVFSDMEADIRKNMPAKAPANPVNTSPVNPAPANHAGATNLTKDELSDFFNAQQEENTPHTKEIAANPPKTNRAAKKGPYVIPSDLLTAYKDDQYWIIDDATKQASLNLKQTLSEFNIEADITGIKKGPVVTMFEILPAPGVKLSKIVALQDNIALSLAAQSVRIVAPIPGKQAVGIEVPNRNRSVVGFREIIEMDLPEWKKMAVPVVLGKDILGKAQLIDLVKTPHMLIAGATGSGKSVCVNSLILSILYKRSFEDVKLILVDPKVVELKLYNNIPHLLVPVITEPKKALQALQWCLCEMERRYALLDGMGVRDISNYNVKIREQKICTEKLPYIVVIIDEFADLMATSGKELETIVARLTAMSRAVGIHLVLATQRPSVNVITGLIKANIPTRIAFMVASRTDSNIIIDTVGAEKLLGRGDMLYASAVDPAPTRIQGTFISDQEVENVVTAVKDYGEPDYIDEEVFVEDDDEEGARDLFGEPMDDDDPLYDQALEIVVQSGKASASYIQRRLKIGYNRAARLVEEMEERGIVGPANGSKPREVIHIP